RGDGSVSHERGVLVSPTGGAIPAFSVDEGHGGLATNEQVLAALDELLAWGTAAELTALPSAAPEPADSPVAPEYVRQGAWQGRESVARVQGVVRRMATRDGVLSGGAERAAAQRYIYPEERAIEEGLTRTFLAAEGPTERSHVRRKYPIAPAKIEIGLEYGALDAVHLRHVASSTGDPIDALAVGHYVGVRPQGAARALDEAISQALPGKVKDTAGRLAAVDLILTQFAERGTLRGELGQPFFVGDPRPVTPGEAPPGARVIAVAGMGLPGRLGVPELTVLTRELCWALGRMGKRHLATVLIGTGRGNLPVGAAAEAWMRGVKHAVTGPTEDERRQIERITFVEHDPRRVEEIHEALVEACRTQDRDRMQIDYRRILDDAEIAQLHKDAEALELAELEELRQARQNRREHRARRAGPVGRELDDDGASAIATRVTIQLDEATSSYRFGAITETASIPERNIPLDPSLVMHANDELAAEWEPELQVERGRFMAGLLVPQDLQPQLSGDAPLVLLLDASAARIHWELLVQSTPSARPESDATDPFDSAEPLRERASEDDSYRSFLGTSRGLTRQLRTTFAPPPEPPPPSRRVLRLLVVADPAEDARLEGAEAEGVEIADLFESFNRVYRDVSDNRVEVVRLFGPREATRTNVLRHLMLRTFDAFHFAGHCVYEAKNPAASGFVFTGGTRISANELKRIDRVPKFVFANACQSGVTPGRSELRSVELAPSFAEAFFARGVSNFVCTAWPVGDWAAREFALTLYAGLLGLVKGAETPHRYQPGGLFAMHEAMREARLAVARTDRDARTWGAYQHYGSPHFRFFSPVTFLRRSNVGDQDVGDRIGGEKAAGDKTAGDKEVEIGAQR
ncbi:MAG: CHAT domain-containing protein, partial [Chloroflexota bacterium]|nr:CHAT domain-containing protein [Chloroflexota bacterium]